ncbi:hypothetical protein, partial [Mycobacteroides abscessus]
MADEPPSVEQLQTGAYTADQIVVEISKEDIRKWSGIAAAALVEFNAATSAANKCIINNPGAG